MHTLSPKLYGKHPVFSSAETHWVESEPGIHLRLAIWRGGNRGTVHIFNGRTEYIEKYGDMIGSFYARGFNVTVHDWRGQGLSTRNDTFPERCHIDDFSEFQRDAHAIMQACKDLPGPRRLFCHSMGGAIGLRYLMGFHDIESVVFSAPMFDIHVPVVLRPFVNSITNWARKNNREWNCVPGTKDQAYETYEPFWRNLLTTNRTEYVRQAERLESFPELATGGPTFYWYFAAKKEIERLQNLPLPEIPALVFLGSREKVVEASAVKAICARSENFQLIPLKGAKHEAFIERPEIRQLMWSHIDGFWLTH